MNRGSGPVNHVERIVPRTNCPKGGQLDRRRLISALAAFAALCVFSQGLAQQAAKVYRIGVLERELAEANPYFNAFRQGLRELGYIEGRNVVFEYRSSEGHNDRYPQLVQELIGLKVDLILTRG